MTDARNSKRVLQETVELKETTRHERALHLLLSRSISEPPTQADTRTTAMLCEYIEQLMQLLVARGAHDRAAHACILYTHRLGTCIEYVQEDRGARRRHALTLKWTDDERRERVKHLMR